LCNQHSDSEIDVHTDLVVQPSSTTNLPRTGKMGPAS